ncbi:uncharacterized protein LOC124142875 [Haliotis rufescens]|uniref:uncharacterized protein LOC124142875 n=1 Tax=Haliotis rufescens TaxID=6454 RepID=UPI00201ECD41|nr:uncharacterized protein LOC124142875 [Haliotis rufescens]
MRSMVNLLLFGTALLLAVYGAASAKCRDPTDEEGLSTDDDFLEAVLRRWHVLGDDDDDDDSCKDDSNDRAKRSADYGYNGFNDFSPNLLASRGGLGSYSGYGKTYGGGYQRFQTSYDVPKPTYQKSFNEGKWQLDNKHMVKNYFKKGTYETAKKFFIALPFVKIIPVKTTTSIDYVGRLQTYDGYKVRLCKYCNSGHPQIEFQSLGKPHRNVIRRFNFLPNTKRSRTEYGEPKIIQTGQARVSNGDSYGGSYGNDVFGAH